MKVGIDALPEVFHSLNIKLDKIKVRPGMIYSFLRAKSVTLIEDQQIIYHRKALVKEVCFFLFQIQKD